jgi:hypothetical protein
MRTIKIKNEGVGKFYTDYELDANDNLCFIEDWKFSEEQATKLCDYLRSSGQLVTTSYNGKTALSFNLLGVTLSPSDVPLRAIALLDSLTTEVEEAKSKSKKAKSDATEAVSDNVSTGVVNEELN